MKQLSKAKTKKTSRTASKEPLAEGIIVPLDSRGRRSWKSMSDKELIAHTKQVIKEKGIKNRRGLRREDGSLYATLLERKLLDRLEFVIVRRDWASMGDDELVEYTKRMIEEKGIKSRSGLQKEDRGLYHTLSKRKLLDRLEFEVKKRERRDWASMDDDQLIEHGRQFIKEKGVKNRSVLYERDCGMYVALRKRKLLDMLEFEEGRRKSRDWTSMDNDQLVEHGRQFIKEKEIKSRSGLEKEDAGLYAALWRRKLLDLVFEDIDKSKEKQAVQDVFDALKEF